MKKISISVSEEILEIADEVAEQTGWSRSVVIRTFMAIGINKTLDLVNDNYKNLKEIKW